MLAGDLPARLEYLVGGILVAALLAAIVAIYFGLRIFTWLLRRKD
ncbi:MAG TPA: hypothetical protein P5279_17705 [Anaerohalosphaeraceae bacterium]|nr:hypothetical protein [Anaerohalosphaeraceae bacterium]HRT88333.1 hypothetical protein [Anaerohalosphaeraceae bacterium]